MLKSKPIGAAATLLVSRSEGEEEQAKKQSEAVDGEQIDRNNSKPDDQVLERELTSMIGDKQQLLQLNIPLNATPGAGLGISIKAQRLGSNDRGLYVRSVSVLWMGIMYLFSFRFYTVQLPIKMRGFA